MKHTAETPVPVFIYKYGPARSFFWLCYTHCRTCHVVFHSLPCGYLNLLCHISFAWFPGIRLLPVYTGFPHVKSRENRVSRERQFDKLSCTLYWMSLSTLSWHASNCQKALTMPIVCRPDIAAAWQLFGQTHSQTNCSDPRAFNTTALIGTRHLFQVIFPFCRGGGGGQKISIPLSIFLLLDVFLTTTSIFLVFDHIFYGRKPQRL